MGSEVKNPKVSHYRVQFPSKWEEEVLKELEVNLYLRRSFQTVYVGFISSFFALVPKDYVNIDFETLLNFSEADFENNTLFDCSTQFNNSMVYGISSLLLAQLEKQYESISICHSGKIFLDSIDLREEETVHLNLNHHQLEIAVTSTNDLVLYNIFETVTGEDILFYTLFALEQLKLDPNKVMLKCYGELLPQTKVFQIFRKYVRHVQAALKDEVYLENFSLFNVGKCESSQVVSEEKE